MSSNTRLSGRLAKARSVDSTRKISSSKHHLRQKDKLQVQEEIYDNFIKEDESVIVFNKNASLAEALIARSTNKHRPLTFYFDSYEEDERIFLGSMPITVCDTCSKFEHNVVPVRDCEIAYFYKSNVTINLDL